MYDRPTRSPEVDPAPADSAGALAAFGRFRFDGDTGELWRDGHAVRLAPKPAQVLAILLASAGSLVSRREIELEVWGDVPIDLDRSVNFAIRQIRAALGDSADSPLYIETLPKRGYRFIAPVAWPSAPEVESSGGSVPVHAPRAGSLPEATDQSPDEAEPGVDTGTSPGSGSERREGERRRGSRLRTGVGIVVAVLVVAALGVGGIGAEWFGASPPTERAMLAVLPLAHLDEGDAQAYFASGLTDELITRLARLDPPNLGVIARTSSRRAAADAGARDADVAERLSANYVLRGSVTPVGDEVRVSLRLVSAADGSVLWADRYLESVPTSADLEFEIASRVADALRARLIPKLAAASADGERMPVPEAREALLRGVWLSRHGPDRRPQALEYVRAAVAVDSTYASARATLGRLLLRSEPDSGRAHLRRAIELDPSAAAPHVSLANDALYAGWDMDRAGEHFRRALELEPGNVLSHHPYAQYLSIAGRHDDAIRHIEKALELDPVSPLVNGDVGRIYYRANRFDEAKRQCRRTLDLQPSHAVALSCLLNIAMLEGDPSAAVPFARALMGRDSVELGERDDAADIMRRYFQGRVMMLRAAAEQGQYVWVALSQAELWLGRTEEALAALEMALEKRSPILPQVPGDPCFAVLAGNPRFLAVMEAMGIP